MLRQRFSALVTTFAALATLVSACAPAATPTPEAGPTSTPQVIVQTQIVAGTPEKVVVTATPDASQPTALPAGSVQINASGATFPLPVYTAWTFAYSYVDPAVVINYQGVGSGAGKKAAIDGTVDFAGSDSLLTDAEKASGKDLQMLPMVASAVVPVIRITNAKAKPAADITGTVTLDRQTLVDIYLGKITKWNDAAIVKLNPDLKDQLPAADIYRVRRADGSGTTEIFTRALNAFDPKNWVAKDGKPLFGSAIEWPAETKKLPGGGGRGNQGVAAAVINTPNSIGYVELSFALTNGLKMVKLVNQAGKPVAANADSINSAMKDFADAFTPDLTAVIVDGKGEGSWPITGYTYLVLHLTSMKDPVKAQKILEYIKWTLTDPAAAAQANKLGYSTLPDAVRAKVLAKLAEVTVNGQPVLKP